VSAATPDEEPAAVERGRLSGRIHGSFAAAVFNADQTSRHALPVRIPRLTRPGGGGEEIDADAGGDGEHRSKPAVRPDDRASAVSCPSPFAAAATQPHR